MRSKSESGRTVRYDMNLDGCRAVVFDLFHTLTSVDALLAPGRSTSEVLGVTREDWNRQLLVYSNDRLRGKITDPFMIIKKMAHAIDPTISDALINEAAKNRAERFRYALINIESSVLETLKKLKETGKSIGLVSNADVNEVMGWDDSPLKPYFDCVVFSCHVGYIKPEKKIYETVLGRLGVVSRDVLYVGDGGSDELRGAKEMGMTTVLVVHVIKRLWPERILKAQAYADHEISSIADLLSLNEQGGASC